MFLVSLFIRFKVYGTVWTDLLVSSQQDTQCTCKRNTQARSCNHFSRRKATSIIYSKCVSVDLGTQREMSMRHVFIRGLTGSIIFLFTLSPKRQDFRNKVNEHKNMCFEFLYICLKHFSLQENKFQGDIIIKVHVFM